MIDSGAFIFLLYLENRIIMCYNLQTTEQIALRGETNAVY